MFIKAQNNSFIINADFCSGFQIVPAGHETPELGCNKEQTRIAATCDGEERVIAYYKTIGQAEEVLDFIAVCLARDNGKVAKLPTQEELERALNLKKSGAGDKLFEALFKKATGCDGKCDNCKEGGEDLEEFLGKLFRGVL